MEMEKGKRALTCEGGSPRDRSRVVMLDEKVCGRTAYVVED